MATEVQNQASSIAAKEGSRDTADNGKGTEKGKQSENSADTADGGKNPGEGGSDTPAKAPRKRTKTGCLTCRRRRIKCGEERPICANCTKSKRYCEGYNQPVIFKEGLGGGRSGWGVQGVSMAERRYPCPIQPAPPGYLPRIAPAPPSGPPPSRPRAAHHESRPPHLANLYPDLQRDPPNIPVERRIIGEIIPMGEGIPTHSAAPSEYSDASTSNYHASGANPYSSAPFPATIGPASAHAPQQQRPIPLIRTSRVPASSDNQGEYPASGSQLNTSTSSSLGPLPSPAPTSGTREYTFVNTGVPTTEPHQEYFPQTEPQFQTDEGEVLMEDPDSDLEEYDEDEDELMEIHQELAPRAAIFRILEAHSRNFVGQGQITFRSYLPDQQTLRAYYPSFSASPLMNPTTAKIFCHFVFVLGPSLSIFERTSPNPTLAFTPGAGLHGPQNVWTYSIPMLSLSNPPLLHAVLALSSLHLAKLTRSVESSSLLHYNIALRRLGKAIGDDKQRDNVATLATALLLAYYETMSAEHDKWNRHLHGAKLLVKRINFEKLQSRIVTLDEMENPDHNTNPEGSGPPLHAEEAEQALHQQRKRRMLAVRKLKRDTAPSEIDETLTRTIVGEGRARRRPGASRKAKPGCSRKELEACQLQSDLFWWFCKMDVFQSIVSGGPLLLDYVFWDRCPPRTRMGTLGTATGSSDYFILLMGRLVDFRARDLSRKKKLEKLFGSWIPPPEMGGPPRGFLFQQKIQERMAAEGRPPGDMPTDGPPPGFPNGPPPGYPNGPPPGYTGGPPPEYLNAGFPDRPIRTNESSASPSGGAPNTFMSGESEMMSFPEATFMTSGGPQMTDSRDTMRGPASGLTGPPPGYEHMYTQQMIAENDTTPSGMQPMKGPPGTMGEYPPSQDGMALEAGISNAEEFLPQTPQGETHRNMSSGGPPPGWQGGPPPGWKGGPPPGWKGGPPPDMSSGGPPPGWQGGPPPGWKGGPPPNMSSGGPPPGWQGGPPPGWKGGPPPDISVGGPPPGWQGGPPSGWQGGPPPNMPPGMMGPPPGTPGMSGFPGMGGPPGVETSNNQGPAQSPEQPPMYGMMPAPSGPQNVPSAFNEVFGAPSPSPAEDDTAREQEITVDEIRQLESDTVLAEIEWKEIRKAFLLYGESLGPDYNPLPPGCMPDLDTPFGPAIYYSTFPMASLQTLYLMGLIILERYHPDMPAMSMQSAIVCAQKTEKWAHEIARITAGFFPNDPNAEINPALGASLVESTVPLFFAGVQYKTHEHRQWLMHKLREIHRMTGWATATRVLIGCYYVWEIAGKRGYGPPFTRPPDEEEEDCPRPEKELGSEVEMEGGIEDPEKNFVYMARSSRLELARGILSDDIVF